MHFPTVEGRHHGVGLSSAARIDNSFASLALSARKTSTHSMFAIGIPSPLGAVAEYFPTFPEILITLGIWALGLLIVTVFYKITLTVRRTDAEYADQAEERG